MGCWHLSGKAEHLEFAALLWLSNECVEEIETEDTLSSVYKITSKARLVIALDIRP